MSLSLEAKGTCEAANTSLVWTDARTLGIGGRAPWDEMSLPRESFWDRFPAAAKANVTRAVWGLSKCSAGEFVEFELSAGASVSALWVNYSLHDDAGNVNPSGGRLSIMPPLGRAGVDLYAQSAATGRWVWAGNYVGDVGKTDAMCGTLTNAPATVVDSAVATRFLLYLPLWRACSSLRIGIRAAEHAAGARLLPSMAAIDRSRKPVVWYGTSIVHGAAVARAGAAFTNVVSRALNRTVYNFGFSGNGRMDVAVALLLRRLDAAAFIVDCNPNLNAASISAKTAPLVAALRAAHPTTPIVLAEGTPEGGKWLLQALAVKQDGSSAALRAEYEKLVAAGDANLHYVRSASLYNASALPSMPGHPRGSSPTVAGTHPSDLGAFAVAQAYIALLPRLLAE